MNLKVAIIAVDYVNQKSTKHKFVSRRDAFNYLYKHYHLEHDDLATLELNLCVQLQDRSGVATHDFYLIEWE